MVRQLAELREQEQAAFRRKLLRKLSRHGQLSKMEA
jgi:hypothetical protein